VFFFGFSDERFVENGKKGGWEGIHPITSLFGVRTGFVHGR
jgi:hypothetical protein